MGCRTRPALYLQSTSKSSPDPPKWASHSPSPRPRGSRVDIVTAQANINTVQPCFYWRSNLGDSLWSHVKVEIQYSGVFTQRLAAALVRSELVALNAPAQEPPLSVGAALAAVAFFSTLVHIWKRAEGRWQEVTNREGGWRDLAKHLVFKASLAEEATRPKSRLHFWQLPSPKIKMHFLTFQTYPGNLDPKIREISSTRSFKITAIKYGSSPRIWSKPDLNQ